MPAAAEGGKKSGVAPTAGIRAFRIADFMSVVAVGDGVVFVIIIISTTDKGSGT